MSYVVKEIFNTLQGEGVRAGHRSVFLRFAFCNLWNGNPDDRHKGKGACAAWCDTDFVGGEKMDKYTIEDRLETLWPDPGTGGAQRWVVITGGEPTLQLDVDLVTILHDQGWKIALETNGTNDTAAARSCDHVTISPKRGPLGLKLPVCHELKVVLPGSLSDEGWTADDLSRLAFKYPDAALYVQPQDAIRSDLVGVTYLHRNITPPHPTEFEQYHRNLKQCIDFVMQNSKWRLSLQTHKMISMP